MDGLGAPRYIPDIDGEAVERVSARIGITRLIGAVAVIREVAPEIGI